MSDLYQIPPEWLAEAGWQNFAPSWSSFRCEEPHILIALADIEKPKRDPGVTLAANGFRHDRMVRILAGIRKNDALPPLSVEDADPGEKLYRLRAGFHRYYASIAAGFSHVPAEVVERLD
jgi:hypothetical protein